MKPKNSMLLPLIKINNKKNEISNLMQLKNNQSLTLRVRNKVPNFSQRQFGSLVHAFSYTLLAIFILLALVVGIAFHVSTTEQGTQFLWQSAKKILNGKLSGDLQSGTIRSGLTINNFAWHDKKLDLSINQLSGQWQIKSSPWRLIVNNLQANRVEVLTMSDDEPKPELKFPSNLKLPIFLDIKNLSLKDLYLYQYNHQDNEIINANNLSLLKKNSSIIHFNDLLASASSDDEKHWLKVKNLTTPWGQLDAVAELGTQSPYPLQGNIHYIKQPQSISAQSRFTQSSSQQIIQSIESTIQPLVEKNKKLDNVLVKTNPEPLSSYSSSSHSSFDFNKENITANLNAKGNLKSFLVDLNAQGQGIDVKAQSEITLFDALPFKQVDVKAEHFNPQLIALNAPVADLNLNLIVKPQVAKISNQQTIPVSHSQPLNFIGEFKMQNALAGPLDRNHIPIASASATLSLTNETQTINAIDIRFLDSSHILGNAKWHGALGGQADLSFNQFNLNIIYTQLKNTVLNGPLAIKSNLGKTNMEVHLKDVNQALDLTARLHHDKDLIDIKHFKLIARNGEADIHGQIFLDNKTEDNIQAILKNFNPLVLTPEIEKKLASGHQAKKILNPENSPQQKDSLSNQPASFAKSQKLKSIDKHNLNDKLLPLHKENTSQASLSSGNQIDQKKKTLQLKQPQLALIRLNGKVEYIQKKASKTEKIRLTKLIFSLANSIYNGLPFNGQGNIQFAENRLLDSQAQINLDENHIKFVGRLGQAGDRLKFNIAANHLEQLGFGISGRIKADGDISGSLLKPAINTQYEIKNFKFNEYHIAQAIGNAKIQSHAAGQLNFNSNIKDASLPGVNIREAVLALKGSRSHHVLTAAAKGNIDKQTFDARLAINGGLFENKQGLNWRGSISELQNSGMPQISLEKPIHSEIGQHSISLSAGKLSIEGTSIDWNQIILSRERIHSVGRLQNLNVGRWIHTIKEISGTDIPLDSNLIIDGDWNFDITQTAYGNIRFQRRSGDISSTNNILNAPFGLKELHANVNFLGNKLVQLKANVKASRIGQVDVDLETALTLLPQKISIAPDAPIKGRINADLPELRKIGALLGPQYLFDGSMALNVALSNQIQAPKLTGTFKGNNLSATLLDLGLSIRDGELDIGFDNDWIDLRRVGFHGGEGTIQASGKMGLNSQQSNLKGKIIADKFEVFASPERQLTFSGEASIKPLENEPGLDIDGLFTVDRALFDLPNSPAPQLGSDVVVIKNGQDPRKKLNANSASIAERPVGKFAPYAHIVINLGENFVFRGAGANLNLVGKFDINSIPNQTLKANGEIKIVEGSIYEVMGRKLAIENGNIIFNGPVNNPTLNILAMRRNQEVEAGVRVTGNVRAPAVKFVSEPDVPEEEKLTWLLFGRGSQEGNNLSTNSAKNAALGLLSNVGAPIAKTVGLDSLSIGSSDSGLSSSQVLMLSKALTEKIVIGYEKGLEQTDEYLLKLTWQFSRYWSTAGQVGDTQGGKLYGMMLYFTRRFD